MHLEDLRFSLTELLSLIGLAQAVYILVYIGFRAGDRRAALLPVLYFFFLAMAFLSDFAAGTFGGAVPGYDLVQWFFWFSGPPLSVLLILQIARAGQLPSVKEYAVLATIPAAFLMGLGLARITGECTGEAGICHSLRDWLTVTGLMAGLCSLAVVWSGRRLLADIAKQKTGHERYWIILTLIIVNLFFLGFTLLTGLASPETPAKATLIRTVLGIALAYLAGTSLFRIYPQTVALKPAGKAHALSENDLALAQRIRDLIELDKIYHEPTCNRTSLARELNVGESVVSRLIGSTYGCTLPHLLSVRRVEDAKRLLQETDAPIKVVSEEVGFNSLNSFNRVFRDITGKNPSDYRQSTKVA